MSRKEQIERQFKEVQRQYAAGELPLPDEDDPTEHWPLAKFCVYLHNASDGGSELVEVFLERAEFRYEARRRRQHTSLHRLPTENSQQCS